MTKFISIDKKIRAKTIQEENPQRLNVAMKNICWTKKKKKLKNELHIIFKNNELQNIVKIKFKY